MQRIEFNSDVCKFEAHYNTNYVQGDYDTPSNSKLEIDKIYITGYQPEMGDFIYLPEPIDVTYIIGSEVKRDLYSKLESYV